ncbi:hypothetical protein BX592_10426 [Paraburkholderia rhizosphaerae]|uniref:Uncharacterized protein n=1 Tax=Paraburkholderia rhizosphaerae TaxID=480658 RepID=A0A4R8M057_9BURK|nr:hypothetical protein BX592_10426 [Paraburkholderia rhizosphaerae]
MLAKADDVRIEQAVKYLKGLANVRCISYMS